jgi:hypothetical protein
MKVVCIDISNFALGVSSKCLSLNVAYDVLEESSDRYFIIDNLGNYRYFYKKRFITLSEWRKFKLLNIQKF